MSKVISRLAIALSLCTPAIQASAQAPAETASACCTIPALTEIEIEIRSKLNSQASKIGEKFPIRLAKPIVVDGKTLVPAGVAGSGDIVHAAKSRFGGKPGEMIVAARYLEFEGVRIPLRSTRFPRRGQGQDQGDMATALAIGGGAIGGVMAMFVTGGEVDVPVGTIANAKISAAITVPPVTEPTNGGKTP